MMRPPHGAARTTGRPLHAGAAGSRLLGRVALLVLLGVPVPACAGDRGDRAAGQTPDSTRGAQEDDTAGAPGTGQAAQPMGLARLAPDSTGAIPIVARLSEYSIRLFPTELNEGAVAITLRNEGERVHTIEIRGDNAMRWRTLAIRPGNSVTLRMDLLPGRYVVRSTELPYVDRGMSAFLLVR